VSFKLLLPWTLLPCTIHDLVEFYYNLVLLVFEDRVPVDQKFLFSWPSQNWLPLRWLPEWPDSFYLHYNLIYILNDTPHPLAITDDNCCGISGKNHKRMEKSLNSWEISTHSHSFPFISISLPLIFFYPIAITSPPQGLRLTCKFIFRFSYSWPLIKISFTVQWVLGHALSSTILIGPKDPVSGQNKRYFVIA
jgi:hypothetical protein